MIPGCVLRPPGKDDSLLIGEGESRVGRRGTVAPTSKVVEALAGRGEPCRPPAPQNIVHQKGAVGVRGRDGTYHAHGSLAQTPRGYFQGRESLVRPRVPPVMCAPPGAKMESWGRSTDLASHPGQESGRKEDSGHCLQGSAAVSHGGGLFLAGEWGARWGTLPVLEGASSGHPEQRPITERA